MEFILFKVCPVAFEEHGCDVKIQTGDSSKLLLEKKRKIDDVSEVNESQLSDFMCECAKLAKNRHHPSMVISAEYLTGINGWYIHFHFMMKLNKEMILSINIR